jgi:hypothetical protein
MEIVGAAVKFTTVEIAFSKQCQIRWLLIDR